MFLCHQVKKMMTSLWKAYPQGERQGVMAHVLHRHAQSQTEIKQDRGDDEVHLRVLPFTELQRQTDGRTIVTVHTVNAYTVSSKKNNRRFYTYSILYTVCVKCTVG